MGATFASKKEVNPLKSNTHISPLSPLRALTIIKAVYTTASVTRGGQGQRSCASYSHCSVLILFKVSRFTGLRKLSRVPKHSR